MWQTSRSLTLTLTLAINPISSLNLNPIPNPIFRTYTQFVPSKLHSSRLFKKSKKDTLKEYVMNLICSGSPKIFGCWDV